MKFYFILILPILICSCGTSTVEQDSAVLQESKKDEVDAPTKILRHVVLFNFNEAATEEVVDKIEKAFADLPSKINEIHAFEFGTNNSPEGLDKGFTHCFLVTFLSEEDRATYLPHPAHQEFVKLIGPYVEDVTVVDYWTT